MIESKQVWRKSMMSTYSESGLDEYECIASLENGQLIVKYDDDAISSGHVVYQGAEIGEGHWQLSGSDGGVATLHRLKDAMRLDGFWEVKEAKGMWRVRLFDSHLDLTQAEDV